jgi:hypothetical protein
MPPQILPIARVIPSALFPPTRTLSHTLLPLSTRACAHAITLTKLIMDLVIAAAAAAAAAAAVAAAAADDVDDPPPPAFRLFLTHAYPDARVRGRARPPWLQAVSFELFNTETAMRVILSLSFSRSLVIYHSPSRLIPLSLQAPFPPFLSLFRSPSLSLSFALSPFPPTPPLAPFFRLHATLLLAARSHLLIFVRCSLSDP